MTHEVLLAADVAGDARVSETPLVDKGFAAVRKIGNGLYATISDRSEGNTTVCNGGFLVGRDAALLAVESLRLVMGELQVADVRAQVMLSLFTDFENFTVFKPGPHQEAAVNAMLDQVLAWGGALKALREQAALSS